MDKGVPPSLFVNDGSFMERFKQLQEQKDKKGSTTEESRTSKILAASFTPSPTDTKTSGEFKSNDTCKTTQAASGGKLAFSLKQKSKLVAPPVKLGADEDESDTANVPGDAPVKRQKLVQLDAYELSSAPLDVGNYCFITVFVYLSDFLQQIYLSTFIYYGGKQPELKSNKSNLFIFYVRWSFFFLKVIHISFDLLICVYSSSYGVLNMD